MTFQFNFKIIWYYD